MAIRKDRVKKAVPLALFLVGMAGVLAVASDKGTAAVEEAPWLFGEVGAF